MQIVCQLKNEHESVSILQFALYYMLWKNAIAKQKWKEGGIFADSFPMS